MSPDIEGEFQNRLSEYFMDNDYVSKRFVLFSNSMVVRGAIFDLSEYPTDLDENGLFTTISRPTFYMVAIVCRGITDKVPIISDEDLYRLFYENVKQIWNEPPFSETLLDTIILPWNTGADFTYKP